MNEELWSYTADLQVEAFEDKFVAENGRPSFGPPQASAS
jgi:hypothetical protein